MRAGESGARIAPEPIDTRKKRESRASLHRTLSVMQCPTVLAFFPQKMAEFDRSRGVDRVTQGLQCLHSSFGMRMGAPSGTMWIAMADAGSVGLAFSETV